MCTHLCDYALRANKRRIKFNSRPVFEITQSDFTPKWFPLDIARENWPLLKISK